MLKYVDAKITFSEVPDEISLCISLSNCPIKCEGCHSKYLWEDIGEPINSLVLEALVNKHKGITCVCIFGGESNISELGDLFKWVKENTNLKLCWYTGLSSVPLHDKLRIINYCDYIKSGPYIKEYGPLTSRTTNQRFYAKGSVLNKMDANPNMFYDITNKFWK